MSPENVIQENQDIYEELSGFANVTDEPLYSVITYEVGVPVQCVPFFPGGQNKFLTNVEKPREIPKGHLKIVEAISIRFFGSVLVADPVLAQSYLQQHVKFAPNADARPRYIPVDLCSSGGGLGDAATITNGLPQKNAIFWLKKPEVLRGTIPWVSEVCGNPALPFVGPGPDPVKIEMRFLGPYAYPAALSSS